MTVAWFTIEDLGVLVRRHRADDSITRALARLIRTDLIIIDDIGLLPVSPDAAEGFYRLVDAAYERRALAVSSNLHPSGFDEIMPKTLATATVDRLLHHAHVVVTQGDSFRLAQATSGTGVTPPDLTHPDPQRGTIWPPMGRFRWPPPGRTPGRLRGEQTGH
jgi:DNA replication protein DnaC